MNSWYQAGHSEAVGLILGVWRPSWSLILPSKNQPSHPVLVAKMTLLFHIWWLLGVLQCLGMNYWNISSHWHQWLAWLVQVQTVVVRLLKCSVLFWRWFPGIYLHFATWNSSPFPNVWGVFTVRWCNSWERTGIFLGFGFCDLNLKNQKTEISLQKDSLLGENTKHFVIILCVSIRMHDNLSWTLQEEIWAKLMALDAYCDNLLLGAWILTCEMMKWWLLAT